MEGNQTMVVRGMRSAMESVSEPGHRATDRMELGQRLLPILYRTQEERFASRGFGQWQPLKRSTVKRHGSHATLRLTGALRASFLKPSALKSVVGGWRYGTAVWYARMHHEGHGVPRRTVLELRRADAARIRQMFEAYITGGK